MIAADGVYGKETEAAVKQFQQATGLKQDGLAGPNVKAMLKLENDPAFQKMDQDTQARVRSDMDKYQTNPAARENLTKLVQDPNFQSVSSESKKLALNALSEKPANQKQLANISETLKDTVTMEQQSSFQNLPPSTQKEHDKRCLVPMISRSGKTLLPCHRIPHSNLLRLNINLKRFKSAERIPTLHQCAEFSQLKRSKATLMMT